MADMLAKAQQWLATVRKSSLATERELTYIRQCSNEHIRLTGKGVVIGASDERLDDSVLSAMDVEERDYIIPRDVFSQHLTQRDIAPERGDIIEETADDRHTYRFRVVTQGGEKAFEWHDRERTAFRVHCNLIGVR